MKLLPLLLVWSLAIVAADAVVIARGDDHHPAASTASSGSSTATSGTGTSTSTSAATGATSATDTTDTTLSVGPSSGPETTSSTPTTTTGTGDTATTVPTCSSATKEVVDLRGDGETPLAASFTVEGCWQIRYSVDAGGNGVAVTVDDDDNPGQQKAFAGIQPGQGTIDVASGCSCTIHVTPDGSGYDVKVVGAAG